MTFEKYISGMTVRDMVTHLLCPAIRSTYRENTDPREYFDVIIGNTEAKGATPVKLP